MRDLRILFMGTPEFAVETLKSIIEAHFNVVGVVTAPDRPAGRGRKLQQSAVKEYALKQNLPVLQPTNLKSDDFLEQLQQLDPNLQVVVAFRMLPRVVWQFPKYGTFNLHASLLPQYRGAAPINWAIINGEEKSGVSTFFIDEKIDTGAMILQQEVEIQPRENAGDLHDKLMTTGAKLVVRTLELIAAGDVKTIPQQESEALKGAHKLTKSNTKINWDLSLENIHNFIRGLSPYPAAWTSLVNGNNEAMMKIYASEKEYTSHTYEIGKVLQEGKEVRVAVKEGFLLLKEVQLPGKRKMTIKDLLNGYEFFPNAKVL